MPSARPIVNLMTKLKKTAYFNFRDPKKKGMIIMAFLIWANKVGKIYYCDIIKKRLHDADFSRVNKTNLSYNLSFPQNERTNRSIILGPKCRRKFWVSSWQVVGSMKCSNHSERRSFDLANSSPYDVTQVL